MPSPIAFHPSRLLFSGVRKETAVNTVNLVNQRNFDQHTGDQQYERVVQFMTQWPLPQTPSVQGMPYLVVDDQGEQDLTALVDVLKTHGTYLNETYNPPKGNVETYLRQHGQKPLGDDTKALVVHLPEDAIMDALQGGDLPCSSGYYVVWDHDAQQQLIAMSQRAGFDDGSNRSREIPDPIAVKDCSIKPLAGNANMLLGQYLTTLPEKPTAVLLTSPVAGDTTAFQRAANTLGDQINFVHLEYAAAQQALMGLAGTTGVAVNPTHCPVILAFQKGNGQGMNIFPQVGDADDIQGKLTGYFNWVHKTAQMLT